MNEPIDWTERKQRAMEHTKRLVEECERARQKKTPPKWIVYDYRENNNEVETPLAVVLPVRPQR